MTAQPTQRDRAAFRAILAWFVQVYVVLMLIWVALNGWSGFWVALAAAAAGATVGTYFARGQPYPWRPLKWLAFTIFFVIESVRGGVDVAARALRPTLRIDPLFEPHPITIPPGLPTTLLTSFISLLPGTLSVRLRERDHELIVHALTPGSMASVTRLERVLAWIFDAERADG